MASELVRQLIDAGIHFGHRASRWNPKMSPYIFGKRNAIHIIDIRETIKGLLRAKKYISYVVASGKDVLFVGTKRQARQHIRQQATRVGMPYVAERWLGGTLTNFRTIRSRLSRLEELETAEADGTAQEYSKKMIASRARELRKISRNLEGIRTMDKLPGAVVVVDVHRERNVVREAKKLGIATICLIDTDSDPDYADVPIPGNDDAMRSIETVLAHLADAVEEGKKARSEPREDDDSRVPRRRSARAATARAEEALPPEDRRGEAGARDAVSPAEGTGPTMSAGSSDGPDAGLAPAAATEPEVSP
ncbi:MAG: 30S ribosomal protein S2 [Phycisphaerales bacterium]|nr:MAG: 30S ribosomal protein S2 [Phycisphaerales bacterium]